MVSYVPVILLYLAGVVWVAWAGRWPDGYWGHHHEPGAVWEYPTETVTVALILITIETAIIGGVLRPKSYRLSNWRRSSAALFTSVVFVILSVQSQMHAPEAWHVYWLWTLVTFATMFILFVWAICASLRSLRNFRNGNSDLKRRGPEP